jgi:hypothetical protein
MDLGILDHYIMCSLIRDFEQTSCTNEATVGVQQKTIQIEDVGVEVTLYLRNAKFHSWLGYQQF